ncbi:telomerase holoenzyme est3 subunit [Diplodia corticola]|uniref:Telomerase holoenzyme est3 subunit n=1 Tax=Diplodia corticola TaxID=236234 RepID=A0A1J9S8I8_9PEZI|nr:telomerase holoenzyme est3 subunit [Diplodia corticola]OJD36823.1 telomerase holoenzyme est3 subunit [Diplodia corticola]
MSGNQPYGILQPWLAATVEDEVEGAMGYWEMSPSQRAKCTASQALEVMYEDDGSNLRMEVYRNVKDKAFVQLVEFTQVEDDEPIDAVVSDSESSIKIRFSKKLREQLEEKMRRRITQCTKGGMVRLKQFEIIVPRFNASDGDPMHLLLKDAELYGGHGAAVYGHPRPIETSPKIRRLLRRFHRTHSENGSDDSASEHTPEGSDDEVLSQGDPSEASQSQFGTQAPFSQPPVLHKRDGTTIPSPTMIKKEPIEQTSAWKQVQPKSANTRQVLALLGQQRGHHVPADASMPPPARPGAMRQHSHSPLSHSKVQSPKQNVIRDVAEEEHEEVADQVMDVADISDLIALDENPIVTSDPRESENPVEEHGPGKSNASEETGFSAELQLLKGAGNPNNTPTSYQIPAVSSSTVTTTNSSLPNVLPTTEKDPVAQASQKCKERLFHHPRWNCVLPATRSACNIPPDQENILERPDSILPSPVGHHFPVGNIPRHILIKLSTKAEERSGILQVPEDDAEDSEDHSIEPENVPTSDISWPESPVRTVKRLADLPPDSSVPEEQDTGESAMFSQRRGANNSHHPDIPSSPPHTSSQSKFQDDPMDDESDLETSVPQAFSYAQQERFPKSQAGRLDELDSRKDPPSDRMSRHVSSSGQLYTHLHLPETSQPLQMTNSSVSGVTLPVTQPPRSPLREEHSISSSAPVMPCSYEVARAPHNTQHGSTFDGSAESKMVSLPDQEDALVERQIQNEQASRPSQRRNLASPPFQDRNTSASPTVRCERASQCETSPARSSPYPPACKDPPIKREAQSPSPPNESRKRVKKSHTNFHFSQDPPISQDPSAHLRSARRQFFTNREMDSPVDESRQRRGSGSSASSQVESELGNSPARSFSARSTRYSVQVKKEHAEEEPNNDSGSRQPSTSGIRRPASSGTNSDTPRVETLVGVKAEAIEDDGPSLSLMETDATSRRTSHEAMDIDIPTGEHYQASAVDLTTTEAQCANTAEDTTHVEETVLLGHSKSPQNEAHIVPPTDAGIADSMGTPGDPTAPSLVEKMMPPTTRPQQTAANDTSVNPRGGADAGLTELGQTEPPGKDPGVTKPTDIFDQFSQAYPEYTGNRKHFENLCGQLEWLRSIERGLHPFLWDDYIIRSRIDFKNYTEGCADEGIDPLPWYKYYVEAIYTPRFKRGIMNPAMLERFFAEQGRPLKPVIHSNVSRMEPAAERGPPSTITPLVDNTPRSRDNHRPRGPRRRGRKTASNLQYGSTGSPLQQIANRPAAHPTTFPATGPSPAPNDKALPSVTSIAHPLPRRPPQPVPAPASGPSPKPPAATAQRPPRGPGQNRPPAPAPLSSATSARAAITSSARAVSNKSLIPLSSRAGPELTAKGIVKHATTRNNDNDNSKRNGNSMPAPSTSTNEKRPNGMPGPPPPASSAQRESSNAKGDKPKPKTMFTMYKEQRKNRSRPGGSRAGSTA